jgi:hypothetical protein
MNERHIFTSVSRISDIETGDFDLSELPRTEWEEADYVAARIVGVPSSRYGLELSSGRIVEPMEGASVVGALGTRAATLEAVGHWNEVGDDGEMHALTGAGLFGKVTSAAHWISPLTTLQYTGHLIRGGRKLRMGDFAAPVDPRPLSVPVILLVGTSMSAGKTTVGRTIIHELKRAGLRVAGAKFTGAGRYRDILSFQDAGADTILDFVDAGLPSTVVGKQRFDDAMTYMLARVMAAEPDVIVAEAGASPLEPYNGASAVAALDGFVRCSVLCASDPYAVLGVQTAFAFKPTLVAGPAANTQAGIDLVAELTGLDAVNVFKAASRERLRTVLHEALPELLG